MLQIKNSVMMIYLRTEFNALISHSLRWFENFLTVFFSDYLTLFSIYCKRQSQLFSLINKK